MLRRPGTDAVSEDSPGKTIRKDELFSQKQNRPAHRVLSVGFLKSLLGIFGRGRSVQELGKWLDIREAELRDWLKGKPPDPRGRDFYYSEFTIPKRRGGSRAIKAPSDSLKALQRRILHRLLNPLPVHAAVTGFVPGRSIVDNARPHVGHGVVINIDLADFFPSITAARVHKAFRALGWGKDAATILANICTYEGRLPQGAPTSPALSNLVCRRLDERLSTLVTGAHATRTRNLQTGEMLEVGTGDSGGRYTRYADDMTISFSHFGRNKRPRRGPKPAETQPQPNPAPSRTLLTVIREIIEGEGFKIQMKKKVRVQRAHQRQTATGLVMNKSINLPREVRRRIRAMQHCEKLGQLDKKGQNCLRGWQALAAMVTKQRAR